MMQAEEMQFLNVLSTELESQSIKLPSFPDAVIQIRNALESEDCDIQKISKLASLETALASRLLQSANSSFYNPAGIAVNDLAAAVMRLGIKEVRNMAIALAVEQIFLAKEHTAISRELAILWRRSVALSAVAAVIAKRCAQPQVDPEKAFLCGLLHETGKLYMVTKAADFPGVTVDIEARSDSGGSWHAHVGRAIAEGWGFSEEIVRTFNPADELSEGGAAMKPDLIDVVYAAELVCAATAEAPMEFDVLSVRRLHLTPEKIAELQPEIAKRMQSMTQTLTG
ncbi:MAG: HDOD domain-containing protein [Pseudomonadota bacterium]